MASPLLIRPITTGSSRLLVLLFAREGHLAAKNLGRQPSRAAITASTVAVAMATIVSLSSVITSLLNGLVGFIDQTLSSDYMLVPEGFFLGRDVVGASPEFAQAIAAVAGVEKVATIRREEATNEKVGAVNVMAIDPKAYPAVADLSFLKGDRATAFGKLGSGRTIIVNALLAARAHLAVGDTLTINTLHGPEAYEVVAQAVDFFNMEAPAVYLSQSIAGEDLGFRNDSMILLDIAKGADTMALENSILALTKEHPTFEFMSFGALRASQAKNFEGIGAMYSVLMMILAIPSLLALANTLTVSVLERAREIGVLRAMGSLRKQVRRMVVAEGLLLAAFGVGMGILTGVAIAGARWERSASSGFPCLTIFLWGGFLLAIGLGLTFGTLAPWPPLGAPRGRTSSKRSATSER